MINIGEYFVLDGQHNLFGIIKFIVAISLHGWLVKIVWSDIKFNIKVKFWALPNYCFNILFSLFDFNITEHKELVF